MTEKGHRPRAFQHQSLALSHYTLDHVSAQNLLMVSPVPMGQSPKDLILAEDHILSQNYFLFLCMLPLLIPGLVCAILLPWNATFDGPFYRKSSQEPFTMGQVSPSFCAYRPPAPAPTVVCFPCLFNSPSVPLNCGNPVSPSPNT